MALFGLFKSKDEREFDQSMENLLKEIFPGGNKDIERDCRRIDALTNGKIHHSKLQGFVKGCKTIAYISQSDNDERFVDSNLARAEGAITRDEAYDVYAYLEGEAKYYDTIKRMFIQMGNDNIGNEDELFGDMPWIYSKGVRSNEIPDGHGEYGLCKTNPIPTISVNCSNRYLSNLRFNGKPVESNRIGSLSSEVTPGSIDIYNLSVAGNDVGTIYICPYHKRNSRTAPRGFSLTN